MAVETAYIQKEKRKYTVCDLRRQQNLSSNHHATCFVLCQSVTRSILPCLSSCLGFHSFQILQTAGFVRIYQRKRTFLSLLCFSPLFWGNKILCLKFLWYFKLNSFFDYYTFVHISYVCVLLSTVITYMHAVHVPRSSIKKKLDVCKHY